MLRKSEGKLTTCTLILLTVLCLAFVVPPDVTALLTTNLTVKNSGTIYIEGSVRPIHIEGRYIKDDLGHVIYLRGAGHMHWFDDPTGWWFTLGTWNGGHGVWNEDTVRAHLRDMRSHGLNLVRFTLAVEWWLMDNISSADLGWSVSPDPTSYRQNLMRSCQIAEEEGLYVILTTFTVVNGYRKWLENLTAEKVPYPPDSSAEAQQILPTVQSYIDYCVNVVTYFKDQNNVLFELWNEPHGLDSNGWATYYGTMQDTIDAIREVTDIPLIVNGEYNYVNGRLGWVETSGLNGSNLLIDTHIYRYFTSLQIGFEYDDLLEDYEAIRHVTQELNKAVLICEIGANEWSGFNFTLSKDNRTEELLYYNNTLTIFNEWGISYSCHVWVTRGMDRFGLLRDDQSTIQDPNEFGQILINAIARQSE